MKKFRRQTHVFSFKIEGQEKLLTFPCKVRIPKGPVTLTLKKEYVEQALSQKGPGDSRKCSMSVCAKRDASAFSHPVEGHIEWFYRSAYVVSKLDKNGMPSECFGYEHHDKIARLNDTVAGQKELLMMLTEQGDRKINLYPPQKKRTKGTVPGSGKKSRGLRKKPLLRGAKLRYATAQIDANGKI